MDIIRAMRLLVPPARQNNPDMDGDLRAFFDLTPYIWAVGRTGGHRDPTGRFAACQRPVTVTACARHISLPKDKLIPAPPKSVSGTISRMKWSRPLRRRGAS